MYYSFENNVQLTLFTRISSLYFSKFHAKYDFTDSTSFYDKNYSGLNTQVLDIGIAFKHEMKHAGFFLQATYTNNNAKIKRIKEFGFQKRIPLYFGIGMSFYWNSFSRKTKPTPMAH